MHHSPLLSDMLFHLPEKFSTSIIQRLTCRMCTRFRWVCCIIVMSFFVFCNWWDFLVLHPQLKLKYFQQNGWLKGWVNTALNIVKNEFAKYNTAMETPSKVHLSIQGAMSSNSLFSQASTPTDDDITDFLDIPIDGIQELNELDEYLSQPLERVHDPIAWWWDHRMVYPRLLRMAFDFLSIPGMLSWYAQPHY